MRRLLFLQYKVVVLNIHLLRQLSAESCKGSRATLELTHRSTTWTYQYLLYAGLLAHFRLVLHSASERFFRLRKHCFDSDSDA
ncbi:hypothetical protein BJ742DRAFT_841813 [Cladochytrium replicatum]|nr:hypothetical protein BJ742DRAFT_841813 [Cladochytrium replicatum]